MSSAAEALRNIGLTLLPVSFAIAGYTLAVHGVVVKRVSVTDQQAGARVLSLSVASIENITVEVGPAACEVLYPKLSFETARELLSLADRRWTCSNLSYAQLGVASCVIKRLLPAESFYTTIPIRELVPGVRVQGPFGLIGYNRSMSLTTFALVIGVVFLIALAVLFLVASQRAS